MSWIYDAWIENSNEIVKILIKLKIRWIVHKFKKMSENTILLMIVLLFWIKWIINPAEYHFYLKTLMGNFLFKWWSESSESTKNKKEIKVIITKII